MVTTAHIGLTLVEQSQSQKEVTVNEAFKRIDALLNTGVIDKDLTAPPSSPAAGDLYIVGSAATGAWASKDKKITYYDQGWKFIDPRQGVTLWVADEDALYRFNGTNWVAVIGNTLGGLTDVDITSPVQYDILQYDGTQFVNTHTFKRAVWIRPEMLRPSATSGCAPLAVVSMGSGKPDLQSFDFDANTQEFIEFALPMPKSWNEGTVTVQYLWSHASTTTNFGVVWNMQALACGDGDSLNASFGTAVSQLDTGGAADTLYISPESNPITIAGTPLENDMVFFRICRSATHGSDTLAIDARLHAIRLFLTMNALTD
ncbi:MAG: DUF2793 domain-containing protein [Rickettsiales bacterium]